MTAFATASPAAYKQQSIMTAPPERLCSPRTLVVAIALRERPHSPRTRARLNRWSAD